MVSDFQPRESYQFFLQEAPELLQQLEVGLLDLKEDHSVSKIHDLMRTAHSIKGGSACVGLNHIQTLAHNLETVFKVISESKTNIDLELEELLLQAYDCLRSPLIEEIQTGKSDPKKALEVAKPIFFAIATKIKRTPPSLAPVVPTQKAHDTDFAFAEELTHGLQRLENILANSDVPEMLEVLKAQIGILKGVGELSQLPSLVAITQVTLSALQNTPQFAHTIGKIALEDCRREQAAILTGKHNSNSKPSQTLIDLAQSQPVKAQELKQLPPKPQEKEITTEPHNSIQSSSPHLPLEVRMDLERLELLNNLVGELVTQDNRFLLQNQQHRDTLDSLIQWFNRFKELTLNLHNRANQFPLEEKKNGNSQLSLHRRQGSYKYIQTNLQTVVEELTQLEEALQDLTLLDQGFHQILKHRQKTLKQVQRNLIRARMLPAGQLLNQFPRMIRDLAAKENKQVKLQLNGIKTPIDKAILDKLYDPLVHLVRNAFDHGIETPQQRQDQGKSLQGVITISIYHRGNQTIIEVEDDGQGINLEKIRSKAITLNWISAAEVTNLSPERLYNYLFASGFSTSTQVSNLSGRGMGLAVVKLQVEALKGTVKVTSEPNRGTTFTLRLPLTLTIVRLLVFRIDAFLLAIPVDTLISITVVSQQYIEHRGGKEFYYWQGQKIPLYPHPLLFAYHYAKIANTSQSLPGQDWYKSERITLLLLSQGEQVIALKIDQILMEQNLVIKPFNEAITAPSCLSGCTILGDGCLVPVLDGSALVEKWLQYSKFESPIPFTPSTAHSSIPLVQVVDDSLTIRQSLSGTLQKAGYQVIQARDGWEALGQLQHNLEIQAVICDIEMPRMNGLELLSRCRQIRGDLPVIMLTSRRSEKYRQLAKQLGANEYLTKPYVDRELLGVLQAYLEKI